MSIHIASNYERAMELLSNRIGSLIFPPFASERLEMLPLSHEQVLKLNLSRFEKGKRFRPSSSWDVVFDGIGWISLTGSGEVSLKIRSATSGILVREPLLPYEASRTQQKFVGKTISAIPENVKKIIERSAKDGNEKNDFVMQ
jgi:hypothetical protein